GFETGSAGHAIRHPVSPLIEHDHAAERRKSVDDATLIGRHLGHQFDMRNEAGVVHHVEGPVPDDAIGNRDVTIARITGRRLHRGSFARPGLSRESTCDPGAAPSMALSETDDTVRAVRLIVARCEVTYTGRLTAFLPESTRLLMLKEDGSVLIHADAGGYK